MSRRLSSRPIIVVSVINRSFDELVNYRGPLIVVTGAKILAVKILLITSVVTPAAYSYYWRVLVKSEWYVLFFLAL